MPGMNSLKSRNFRHGQGVHGYDIIVVGTGETGLRALVAACGRMSA